MSTYAYLKNGIVENIIVAEESWINSQENSSSYIEYTEENPAAIGGDYFNGYFYPPKNNIFSNWIRDGKGNWINPIPKPDDNKNYYWNVGTNSWEVFDV